MDGSSGPTHDLEGLRDVENTWLIRLRAAAITHGSPRPPDRRPDLLIALAGSALAAGDISETGNEAVWHLATFRVRYAANGQVETG